jgi:hypothetical protein
MITAFTRGSNDCGVPAAEHRALTTTTRHGVEALFDLSKIEDCIVLDATFRGSRGQVHRAHLAWEVLYARVA